MLCYKDRTYCNYGVICKNSLNCPRVLTDDIKKQAEDFGLPLCLYSDFPECFEPWFMEDENDQIYNCMDSCIRVISNWLFSGGVMRYCKE